jgi:hypothetical protein
MGKGQSRNSTGTKFEKYMCEVKGWTHKSASPRLTWTGVGKSQFMRSKSLDFDADKFKPVVEDSRLVKYDAIDQNGNFIEIKDYPVKKANKWLLYSEFFAVKRKNQLKGTAKVFGDGDVGKSVETYNNFIPKLIKHFDEDFINKLVSSNIGVQFRDEFVSNDNLEFRASIIKNAYEGYDRLKIEFKLKS